MTTTKNHHKAEFGGQTFARNSDRVYTHVVIGFKTEATWCKEDNWGKAEGFPKWVPLRWTGRRDLAEKAIPEFSRYGYYTEFKIIEVD